MKVARGFLLLLTLAGIAQAQDFHPKRFNRARFALSLAFVALQGIDVGATEAGFRGSTPEHRWQENNPLIPHSTAGRGAYFGLTGAGVLLTSNLAAMTGHRKLSLLILGIGIATEGYADTHSLIGLQH